MYNQLLLQQTTLDSNLICSDNSCTNSQSQVVYQLKDCATPSYKTILGNPTSDYNYDSNEKYMSVLTYFENERGCVGFWTKHQAIKWKYFGNMRENNPGPTWTQYLQAKLNESQIMVWILVCASWLVWLIGIIAACSLCYAKGESSE